MSQKGKSRRLDRKIKKGKVARGRSNVLVMQGTLSAKFKGKNGDTKDFGIIANRVVTNAGVAFLVDAFQNNEELENFKYHDSGVGVGSEAVGDTALGTPCAESRDTGTQIEGASANIYKSVAEHTYADTFAITEHGLFSASTNGILWDRSKFTAINVVSGDKIEFTYELTCTAGG